MRDSIPFGGSSVNADILSFDEFHRVGFVLFHSLDEFFPIYFWLFPFNASFFVMSRIKPITSAVDFIFFHFVNFQSVFFVKINERLIIVILKMFSADVPDVVHFNHLLGGHKLSDEYAVVFQMIFNVRDKTVWIFAVVKHTDCRDYIGFIGFHVFPEFHEYFFAMFFEFLCQIGCRLNANPFKSSDKR